MSGRRRPFDPSREWFNYWPRRKREPIDILVAGCGSNEAPCIAFTNRESNVLGIDISGESLRHAHLLKERYALDNLELRVLDLNHVDSLDRRFDLIISNGVIHHLPEPTVVLTKLGRLLKLDGTLAIMLYGKIFRAGVYFLQDAFRRMGLTSAPNDVAFVRQALGEIGKGHAVQRYLQTSRDWRGDGGLADTFLNPIDHSYTVPELMKLVEDSGLAFQKWLDRGDYCVDTYFPPDSAIGIRLSSLDEIARAASVEMLTQAHPNHWFMVCRPDRPLHSRSIDEQKEILACRVHRRFFSETKMPGEDALDPLVHFIRKRRKFSIRREAKPLLEAVNGQRNPVECLSIATETEPRLKIASEKMLRDFFVNLCDRGHVLLSD